MKKIILISLFLFIFTSCSTNECEERPKVFKSGISFLFPKQFGRAFRIKAEIIERPRTYYARNYNKTPFYLKVIEVEGEPLVEPIISELKTSVKDNFEFGEIKDFHVYERLREVGYPRIGDLPVKTNLHYRNQLVEIKEEP